MRKRLQPVINRASFPNPYQFGFRKGLSSEDALYYIRDRLRTMPGKYDCGLRYPLVPSLLAELARRRCPLDLALLLADYLEGRTVQIQGNHQVSSLEISRGCQQGSILRTELWNLVMASLLRDLEVGGQVYATYADDLIILLEGNTRRV